MDTTMKCREDLLCGVNRIGDTKNMNDLEREHMVAIAAPEQIAADELFEVVIEVGEHMSHPNQPSHYIDFIDLYADDTYIARLDLTPKMTLPVMKAQISLSHAHGALRAFAHCNIHGIWEGRMPIEVTEPSAAGDLDA